MSADPSPSPDELNRLWQHGLHEERLFHDRLNYFSALEMGLLTACAILYNKDIPNRVLIPLSGIALIFTLLWFTIQHRHWHYCVHVNSRLRQGLPEYRKTLESYWGQDRVDGFSISKPLALATPVLFALAWLVFFAWVLGKPVGLA